MTTTLGGRSQPCRKFWNIIQPPVRSSLVHRGLQIGRRTKAATVRKNGVAEIEWVKSVVRLELSRDPMDVDKVAHRMSFGDRQRDFRDANADLGD